MNTADLQNSVEGGIQAKRGFRFETYALLFYLLIRLKEHPSLEVIIEPEEGEDAKFTYPADQNNGYQQITELIQYKKRESSQAEKSDTGEVIEDTWREGEITPYKFKKWVTTKRPKFSTVDFLGSNKNVFFTAIVFGDLTPGVRKFIPKDLPRFTSFSSYSSDFAKVFPANYKHLEDPIPSKARFSTEEIRAKIRLLRFASPDILDAQCRRILEDVYGNSRRLAPDIVDRLLIEIARRETVKGDETRRRLFGHELNSIIATGKTEQGLWREAKKLLDAANASSMGAHPVEPFSSIDFESGQYVHFSKYDEAWEGLERVGFIGISGSAGIGKSTLASYLIFRFLKQYPTADAYYLNVRAGETLVGIRLP
jgi:hypothetical protein